MLEQLYSFTLEYLSQSEVVLQLFIAGVCLFLASMLSWVLKRYIRINRVEKALAGHEQVYKFMVRLKTIILPFLAVVAFGVGGIISQKLTGNFAFLKTLTQLSTVWLMLSFIWAVTSDRSITTLMAFVAATIALLNYYGLLAPTIAFLDNLAFNFGNHSISLYQLLKGTLVLLLLLMITNKLSAMGKKYLWKTKEVNANARDWLYILYQGILYFVVVLVLLDLMGFNFTSLTIFTSAVVVGVGFGTQKIASNFLSGLLLLFERTIEIDDVIELQDGNWAWVRRLGGRATLVETFDGKEILLPNEELITQAVTNLTLTHSKARIRLNIRVSYNSDLEKARLLMLEAAAATRLVSRNPPPECFLYEFQESAAAFVLLIWLDDVSKGRFQAQSDVLYGVWTRFKAAGIEIPYPRQDILIKQSDFKSS